MATTPTPTPKPTPAPSGQTRLQADLQKYTGITVAPPFSWFIR